MNFSHLATGLIPRFAWGVVVGAVILTSGCCKKPKGKSSSAGPSPTTSVAPKRVIEMSPGSDEPPSTWNSPQESKAAAPDFAQSDGYAPQLSEQVKARLSAMPEDLDAPLAKDASPCPCLVLCSVKGHKVVDKGIFKMLTNTVAPDMNVLVILETGVEVLERGPDNQSKVFVSFPLVDCSARNRWKFHLVDRDTLGFSDNMGTTHVTPPFPLENKDAVADIACRAVDRDRVEKELEEALPLCDARLKAIVQWMKVDPTDPSLGVEPVLTQMQSAVSNLAGWVGWADPRVVRRREWGLRILTAIREERLAFVKEHASGNPEPVTFQHSRKDYEVSSPTVDCHSEKVQAYRLNEEKKRLFPQQRANQTKGSAPKSAPKSALEKAAEMDSRNAIACLLTLDVRNLGEQTLASSLGQVVTWSTVVARDDGETVRPRLLGIEKNKATYYPNMEQDMEVGEGAKVTVVLGLTPLAFADGKKPVLMVMNPMTNAGPVFIPLPREAPPSDVPSP